METLKNHLPKIQEVELVYRSKIPASERPKITTSDAAYELLLNTWEQTKLELLEQFKVIFLSTGNKVLGIYHAFSGGISGTVADIRLIYAAALKANATSIIVAHNHPSGNLKPSPADRQLTLKLVEAGKLLEISMLDHLILSPEGFYSFADEGAL